MPLKCRTLQTRISYDLLTELANCVLNESIFDIVKALMELQHVTEKHLIQMRAQVENEYEIEVADWRGKIKDPEELQHILGLMNIKHTKKLLETDKKIIEVLDQKASLHRNLKQNKTNFLKYAFRFMTNNRCCKRPAYLVFIIHRIPRKSKYKCSC